MGAHSKWSIEYNIAQLLQKEDYLPRFFKIIRGYEQKLKDYKVEKMRKAMNMTTTTDFLMKNVDEC